MSETLRGILILLFVLLSFITKAQPDHGFPFGEITLGELVMTQYEPDTAAEAFYINEYGDAFVQDGDDITLAFEYHAKIKILKAGGLEEANFNIPIQKYSDKKETLTSLEASAFTLENGKIKEMKLDTRNVFTQNQNKNLDRIKFTLPNVHVGSVIEVYYIIESPFLFNFRPWAFQDDIPKVRSEFRATIPGNYRYNISLRGFLSLTTNTSDVISDCFKPNGNSADCARYTFGMINIPAFVEEDYMTAPSNFISSLNFELSEIKYFDGHSQKFTKEWKDVDFELKHEDKFGLQLKRGKDIVDEKIDQVIKDTADPLTKAKKIYDFIKYWYQWNDVTGKYSEYGIKKAFDTRKGNVGDINLSLIAALRYGGLDVEPLILSTRENGLPLDVHPVLSDFNYVIAKLNIGDKVFLLDATDRFLPFGVLPIRCLNGKGRVLNEKESYWMEIKPSDKKKKVTTLDLTLGDDGLFRGSLQNIYSGYEAIKKREELGSFLNQDEYIRKLKSKMEGLGITKFQLDFADDVNKPFVEKMEVEIEGFSDLKSKSFFFNPFFVERWEKNPFQSNERNYPVDFGVPIEEVVIISIVLPPGFEPIDLPGKIGLALPNNGGRYIFDVKATDNRIVVNHALLISRPVYSPDEYHYLKELFNQLIQVQNVDLVFRRKP